MRETVKNRPLAAVSFIAAVVLVIGLLTFAGPCVHEDGSAAACHAAWVAAVAGGAVGALASLGALLMRKAKSAGCVLLLAAVAGLFSAAAPGTLFGMCLMQTMRCWAVMRPFALVCGGILFLCALIGAVMMLRARDGRPA